MPAIDVTALTRRYGSHTALDGIDLRVETGEVYAVLGPNGAGKTTCMEILEGYRHRDSGRVRVLGDDPQRAGSAWRERIGVMLQATSVEPNLTVAEHLRLYGSLYRHPVPAGELLAQVGLTDAAQQRAGTLSGGQQRRLDLALTLVGRPELVFLDEPTTGFDPHVRRRTWELIRSLAAAGTTVLLTTHYLEEAAELADRVAVIAGGRIVAEGDPATLGGHDLRQAIVRFRAPADLPALVPAGSATVPSARPAPDDGVVEIRTHTPTAELAKLTGWAADHGVELDQLTVTRPTLEEIYLALTEAPDA
ncbi:MAG: ABC transporter ATP-binding protein [Micromonosporaceae bacterium]